MVSREGGEEDAQAEGQERGDLAAVAGGEVWEAVEEEDGAARGSGGGKEVVGDAGAGGGVEGVGVCEGGEGEGGGHCLFGGGLRVGRWLGWMGWMGLWVCAVRLNCFALVWWI